jgi:hypothetical protein
MIDVQTLVDSVPVTVSFGEGMDLPIDAALARYVDLGKSGAGKSNTLIVKAEEFIRAGVPVWEMDPLGNLYGQRSGADGNSAGLPIVVFGGAHADLELPSATSACDLVAHERLSAIFDLSELEWSEQRAFAEAFCTHLIYLADRIDLVGHLMLDEADRFAPNTIGYNACKVFARVARNKSIGWTFSTQRPQILSPEVIESANVICAMRIPSDLAQESILRKVSGLVGKKRAGEMIQQLAAMKKGECWFIPDSDWLPHLNEDEEAEPTRFRWRLRDTFDSTSPRRIGEARIEAKVTAEIDIERLREKLATSDDVVTNSTNDSNSTKYSDEEHEQLRARVEDLEAQIAAFEERSATSEIVEVQVVTDEDRMELHNRINAIGGLWERIAEEAKAIEPVIARVTAIIDAVDDVGRRKTHEQRTQRAVSAKAITEMPLTGISKRQIRESSGNLNAHELRVLEALVRRLPAQWTSKPMIAALAGRSVKSSAFEASLRTLLANKLIDARDDGKLRVLPAGVRRSGMTPPTKPMNVSDAVAVWRQALGKTAGAVLLYLVDRPVGTKEQVANATGYSRTSSGFEAALRELRENGLIAIEGDLVTSTLLEALA